MYPRISDLINDLTGLNLKLPIQSFGFFVALAFLAAYYLIQQEVRRRQALGEFPTRPLRVMTGGPIPMSDVLVTLLVYSVLGYKFGLMVEDYEGFYSDPQGALFSLRGSWLIGLLAGLAGGGYQFFLYQQRRNTKPVYQDIQAGLELELGTVFTIAFVAGILGAKVFHNLEYWDDFVADPIGALTSFSGLTFYGGLICATVAIAIYIHRKGYKILPFADAVAPALMLGYAIGRIGCQMAGDGDWGINNTAPKPGWMSFLPDWMWSFTYPHNVLNQGVDIPGCTGDFCRELAIPVFPTPFYETLMAGALFVGLWAIRKRLPYWGQLTSIYLIVNGIERFLIEKIRVNSTYDINGFSVTQAELISSALVLFGLVLLYLTTSRWKLSRENPTIKPAQTPAA
ncbi:MAG: prolipoprotein diacylglyceryl transferase [Bacteroidia bacterium]|nr:prolipoprotein diacylglyceryl transferase [Bacteroidia bacterium]